MNQVSMFDAQFIPMKAKKRLNVKTGKEEYICPNYQCQKVIQCNDPECPQCGQLIKWR